MAESYDEPVELERWEATRYADCVRYCYGIDDSGLQIVGRTMIAARDIPEGTLIETAPVVPMYKVEDSQWHQRNLLYCYMFNWGEARDSAGKPIQDVITGAYALGYSAVYNHSDKPNIKHVNHYEDFVLRWYAKRDIVAGEELQHDYQWVDEDIEWRLGHIDGYMRPVDHPWLHVRDSKERARRRSAWSNGKPVQDEAEEEMLFDDIILDSE